MAWGFKPYQLSRSSAAWFGNLETLKP
jgi:hypothetical protein